MRRLYSNTVPLYMGLEHPWIEVSVEGPGMNPRDYYTSGKQGREKRGSALQGLDPQTHVQGGVLRVGHVDNRGEET